MCSGQFGSTCKNFWRSVLFISKSMALHIRETTNRSMRFQWRRFWKKFVLTNSLCPVHRLRECVVLLVWVWTCGTCSKSIYIMTAINMYNLHERTNTGYRRTDELRRTAEKRGRWDRFGFHGIFFVYLDLVIAGCDCRGIVLFLSFVLSWFYRAMRVTVVGTAAGFGTRSTNIKSIVPCGAVGSDAWSSHAFPICCVTLLIKRTFY